MKLIGRETLVLPYSVLWETLYIQSKLGEVETSHPKN